MKVKTYWAWFDKKDKEYYHVYRRKFQVEMCSLDGFKTSIKCGEGRIVEVKISEVNK